MIALSFLGLGQYNKETKTYSYQETTYSFNGKKVKTSHFPYAVSEFIKPEKLFIIMTDKADEVHADSLKKICNYEPIKIPDGKSEDEFWIIFDKITSVINEGDEIVFDITHGFRSQPFIVIVLLLYLKSLKNIKIKNIIYGAFEAKDQNNITPVFELKSFIDLVDWSNAVREFTENGNMKYFNTLLSEIHKNSYLKKLPNPSKELKGAGEDLSKLTDAFSTIRLEEIFQNTFHFNKRLENLKTDFENYPQAKPFSRLIDKIKNQFQLIADAEKQIFSEKGFEAQKAILVWYLETNKYQKAITLAREFIVSKFMVEISKIKNDSLWEKSMREEAEKKLGDLFQLSKNSKLKHDRRKVYADIWKNIVELRNDINHAGMRPQKIPAKKIIENSESIIKIIQKEF